MKTISSRYDVAEIVFESSRTYSDPFNEIDLDVHVVDPQGIRRVVPAFWAGQNTWKVRYSSGLDGEHSFVTHCTDSENTGLHKVKGRVTVKACQGGNPLLTHGPLKVSSSSRYLEHADGTPFFWLADTWWTALTGNFRWPDMFNELLEDRLKKGYTVIQVIAGLLPGVNCAATEESLASNEGGWPWTKGFAAVNPSFFDHADVKIRKLVEAGLVPCIFGAWGHYLRDIGMEKIKKHWRYLVARWSAYPVVWSVAGEARFLSSPDVGFFDFDNPLRQKLLRDMAEGWSEVARYVRALDPFKRLSTVHPSPGDLSFSSWDVFSDPTLFDYDMLQTGHYGVSSYKKTMETLEASLSRKPAKPVINGECNYEGIMGSNSPDIVRFLFWAQMLSGAAGITYGAWGVIFAFHPEDEAGFGDKAYALWGDFAAFRDAAYAYPGAGQLGMAKRFLERFAWHRFEPHPEWVEPHATPSDRTLPYAAGIPGAVVVVYIPPLYLQRFEAITDFVIYDSIKVCGLSRGAGYATGYFNPRTGQTIGQRTVTADEKGEIVFSGKGSGKPNVEDWVLVVERIKGEGTR